MGFEFFEHQCKLQKAMKKLVKKYPVIMDSDSDADGERICNNNQRIEGINVQATGKSKKHTSNEKYKCPITKELMRLPVIAYDDCVYEKEAIIKYLRQYHTTPKLRNEKLANKEEVEQMINMLFPHDQMQAEIENL